MTIFAASAFAAEVARISIQNGLASVEVPEEWTLEEGGDYHAAILSPGPDSRCRLVLALPNPVVNANQLAAMEIVALSLAMGGHEIIEAAIGQFKGRERMRVHFAAPYEDGFVVGLMHLMYYGDHVAMASATGPDGEFDEFIGVAVPIMESYELDEGVMGQRRLELRRICEKLKEETIKEYLEYQTQSIPNQDSLLDDMIIQAFPKGVKKAG